MRGSRSSSLLSSRKKTNRGSLLRNEEVNLFQHLISRINSFILQVRNSTDSNPKQKLSKMLKFRDFRKLVPSCRIRSMISKVKIHCWIISVNKTLKYLALISSK